MIGVGVRISPDDETGCAGSEPSKGLDRDMGSFVRHQTADKSEREWEAPFVARFAVTGKRGDPVLEDVHGSIWVQQSRIGIPGADRPGTHDIRVSLSKVTPHETPSNAIQERVEKSSWWLFR